jgi:hypothetical protein
MCVELSLIQNLMLSDKQKYFFVYRAISDFMEAFVKIDRWLIEKGFASSATG